MLQQKSNIVLIGMPGAGKSTVGRYLARRFCMNFVDGDELIEQTARMPIQRVVDRMGLQRFSQIEERVLCDLSLESSIISTGGSAVYCDKAMRKLQQSSVLVYLRIAPQTLLQRVDNATSRGLHKLPAHPLMRVYRERIGLYPRYADIVFDNDQPFTDLRATALVNQLSTIKQTNETNQPD